MNITLKWLEEKEACKEGIEYFEEVKITDGAELIRKLIKDKKLDWADWGVVRMLNHDNQIRYAIYAAELVIKIFEDRYPGDNRPSKAIEAAERYLKTHSEEDIIAARAAADAATNAATDAADAADAAYATYAATRAAVYATYAAHAAGDKLNQQIIEYGITLLESQEKP